MCVWASCLCLLVCQWAKQCFSTKQCTNTLSLCSSPPFLLSLSIFYIELNTLIVFHTCLKLVAHISVNYNFPCKNKRKLLVGKRKNILSFTAVICRQMWLPLFTSPAVCYQGFPWKVNIYLISGLLGPELSSFSSEEEGVSTERSAKTDEGRRV